MGTKLSKILDSLQKLQNLNYESYAEEAYDFTSNINKLIGDLSVINQRELNEYENKLKNAVDEYLTTIKKFESRLHHAVYSNKVSYLKQSEKIYKENIEKMLFEEQLEWAPLWPPGEVELKNFHNNIINHCNWQYGGLIIGAKSSSIFESVLATEPFYVIEKFNGYLNLLKEKYHPDAVRKFKYYLIDDLKKIPNNSLGLIVVFNEFNFLPWNISNYILIELAKKLIPGGVLIFNYNNCETVKGFTYFETNQMVYSTPDMFDDLLQKHQLTCIKKYDSDLETFSFLVFKKHGQKRLIKRYPSIGFIKQQPTLLDTATHQKRLEHIRKLVERKNAY